MYRFFLETENIIDDRVRIIGDDAHHIIRSLRLETGEKIIGCDSKGTDYIVELLTFSSSEIIGKIIQCERSKGEPEINVTLLQGIPKSDKMDLIVQKSTELGVTRIIPIETQRTIVKLTQEKSKRRLIRWQRIALEAAKQSGRGKIPVMGPILSWTAVLDYLKEDVFDLILLPWEGEQELSLKKVLKSFVIEQKKKPENVIYLIGPEGGFAREEVDQLIQLGAMPVTLGSRILRTETAGFTALTLLMYEFDEMEGSDHR